MLQIDARPRAERGQRLGRSVRIERNTTGAAGPFRSASKAGNQIGDIVVRDNTIRSATGRLVFVSARRGECAGCSHSTAIVSA